MVAEGKDSRCVDDQEVEYIRLRADLFSVF